MPQRLFHVLAKPIFASFIAASAAVLSSTSSVFSAPLLETDTDDLRPATPAASLTELTSPDDNFLVWNDASSAVARPYRATVAAESATVVGNGEALRVAFDGENPIVPVPPALIAGVVGLLAVTGITVRRQNGTRNGAKVF